MPTVKPVLCRRLLGVKFSTLNGDIGARTMHIVLRPELANCHSQSFRLIRDERLAPGQSSRSMVWDMPTHLSAELAIERSAWLVTADREFEKMGRQLFTMLLPRR